MARAKCKKALGGTLGGTLGALAGTAVAGPIGTTIGSSIGATLGEGIENRIKGNQLYQPTSMYNQQGTLINQNASTYAMGGKVTNIPGTYVPPISQRVYYYKQATDTSSTKVQDVKADSRHKTSAKYATGGTLYQYFVDNGIAWTPENRTKIAAQVGVKDYSTYGDNAAKNQELLNALISQKSTSQGVQGQSVNLPQGVTDVTGAGYTQNMPTANTTNTGTSVGTQYSTSQLGAPSVQNSPLTANTLPGVTVQGTNGLNTQKGAMPTLASSIPQETLQKAKSQIYNNILGSDGKMKTVAVDDTGYAYEITNKNGKLKSKEIGSLGSGINMSGSGIDNNEGALASVKVQNDTKEQLSFKYFGKDYDVIKYNDVDGNPRVWMKDKSDDKYTEVGTLKSIKKFGEILTGLPRKANELGQFYDFLKENVNDKGVLNPKMIDDSSEMGNKKVEASDTYNDNYTDAKGNNYSGFDPNNPALFKGKKAYGGYVSKKVH